MRQLQVVGLADDASSVVLEDPVRHERFNVPCDERLRAAARGDIRRLGQMDIEMSSPLRPRDIQARVRGGESPEQVAATAGVSASQVERFAYPVLLERQRVAELATRAHPLRDDRPHPRTLGEIAAETFAARGQEYDDAVWDAWKGEDARWVIALSWRTGRSDNVAHWTFRPGSSGGTLAPRDDAAHEITGSVPPSGPRRSSEGRTRPGPEQGLEALPPAPSDDEEVAEAEHEVRGALVANGEDLSPRSGYTRGTSSTTSPASTPTAGSGTAGAPSKGSTTASGSVAPGAPSTPSTPTVPSQGAPGGRERARPTRSGRTERPGPAGVPGPRGATRTDQTRTDHRTSEAKAPEGRSSGGTDAATPTPGSAESAEPTGSADSTDQDAGGESGRRGRKRQHPQVPSWEDVLLGVRSPKP